MCGVGGGDERVLRPRRSGRPVQAQGLAAQRGEVLRVGPDRGVTGADDQGAVPGDQQAAATVPPAAGRKPGEQGLHPGGLGRRGVQAPGDHPDVVSAAGGVAALAGVEAPVPGVVGVDGQRHQPRLAGGPDRRGRERHPAELPGAPGEQVLRLALGDQDPTAARVLRVPRQVEPAHHPGRAERRNLGPGEVGGVVLDWAGAEKGPVSTVVAQTRPLTVRTRGRMGQASPGPAVTACSWPRRSAQAMTPTGSSCRSGNSAGTDRSGNLLLTISPRTLR